MDTDAITTLLQDVAAEVINPRFRSLSSTDVHEKNPGDLVTVADQEAEVLITAALQGAYPRALVLGEEATAADPGLLERYAAAEHAFTVDPVDGTKNFVHGSPDHAVMACELQSGQVVRSWIWQPQHQLMYVAELGAGAWRNGERLTFTAPSDPTSDPTSDPPSDPPRVATSRRSWVGRDLPGLRRLTLSWVSCGIDFPRLVEGGTESLLYASTKPWDHAPGALLVSEAGGIVRTLAHETYDPRYGGREGLIAAPDLATYELVQTAWHSDLR